MYAASVNVLSSGSATPALQGCTTVCQSVPSAWRSTPQTQAVRQDILLRVQLRPVVIANFIQDMLLKFVPAHDCVLPTAVYFVASNNAYSGQAHASIGLSNAASCSRPRQLHSSLGFCRLPLNSTLFQHVQRYSKHFSSMASYSILRSQQGMSTSSFLCVAHHMQVCFAQ